MAYKLTKNFMIKAKIENFKDEDGRKPTKTIKET